jgi:hypothetical protein
MRGMTFLHVFSMSSRSRWALLGVTIFFPVPTSNLPPPTSHFSLPGAWHLFILLLWIISLWYNALWIDLRGCHFIVKEAANLIRGCDDGVYTKIYLFSNRGPAGGHRFFERRDLFKYAFPDLAGGDRFPLSSPRFLLPGHRRPSRGRGVPCSTPGHAPPPEKAVSWYA